MINDLLRQNKNNERKTRNTKPKPIAIIVRALRALTLRAISLALVLDRYQGKAPWPAVLAALLCSVIGGYLVTRLAHVRELAIAALAGLLMLLVGAVATRLAPSISPPDNLLMLIWTGGGALGSWLTRVRLSWIGREYERLRQRYYCIHHSRIGRRMTVITKMLKENKMKGGKTMKAALLSALMTMALLALVSCTTSPEPTPEAAELHLKVGVNMDVNGEVVLRFGVHNKGPADFPGDKDFVGKWELTDEAGTLRASGSLTTTGLLGSGKTAFPAEWKGELVPGAYTLTWSAADYGLTVVGFTVVERNRKLSIGEQVTQVFDDYDPQDLPAEGEKVYPLAVSPGEWLEYEIVSACNFTLRSSIQVGDRIRYEIIDTKTGQKVSLDGKIVILHEVPICDLYVNGEKVAEQVEQGILFPADVQFWNDYQAIEVNWEKEASKMGRAYESEIRIESDRILFEYSLDITSWTRISTDRGTGIVLDLERVVDMQGNQVSYHFVLADTSVMGVRL